MFKQEGEKMFNKEEALKKLNSEQYEVTQHAATEYPLLESMINLTKKEFMLMWYLVSHYFLVKTNTMLVVVGQVLLNQLKNLFIIEINRMEWNEPK